MKINLYLKITDHFEFFILVSSNKTNKYVEYEHYVDDIVNTEEFNREIVIECERIWGVNTSYNDKAILKDKNFGKLLNKEKLLKE